MKKGLEEQIQKLQENTQKTFVDILETLNTQVQSSTDLHAHTEQDWENGIPIKRKYITTLHLCTNNAVIAFSTRNMILNGVVQYFENTYCSISLQKDGQHFEIAEESTGEKRAIMKIFYKEDLQETLFISPMAWRQYKDNYLNTIQELE